MEKLLWSSIKIERGKFGMVTGWANQRTHVARATNLDTRLIGSMIDPPEFECLILSFMITN
jgi:hypothetical protein